jgi:Pyruvate/2-oxoacid:ferredoxin oxidoreductase delta subunit
MSTAHVKVERICPENATETTTGSNVSSPPPGRSTLVQDMKNRLEDLDDGTSQASRPSYCSVKVRLHNLYTPGSRAYRQWNGGVPYIEYRAGGTRTKVFVGSVVTTLVSGPATIEPDEPSSVTPSVPCGTCHGYSWVASGWNAPVGKSGTWTWNVSASPGSKVVESCTIPAPHQRSSWSRNIPVSTASEQFTSTGAYNETSKNWTGPSRKCISCEDCGYFCDESEVSPGTQTRGANCVQGNATLGCIEAY